MFGRVGFLPGGHCNQAEAIRDTLRLAASCFPEWRLLAFMGECVQRKKSLSILHFSSDPLSRLARRSY